ncbi:hypothetical protein PPERSA_00420 [Pseudocohnilembus persalinus]|uniref:Uncharacterized protein n=1 Tax=Pseudocohnilembus persalinus TaxID=266149 RepID=A0A0V0QY40_PSEPJ|nr:hypothetical protein PPERSA_00420 [Pseudocohnilembus persalinus]|eukprot:KRX07263.1 hypothetical protein PPERSA_00420 [Pseudocohnilembus persalinus]
MQQNQNYNEQQNNKQEKLMFENQIAYLKIGFGEIQTEAVMIQPGVIKCFVPQSENSCTLKFINKVLTNHRTFIVKLNYNYSQNYLKIYKFFIFYTIAIIVIQI